MPYVGYVTIAMVRASTRVSLSDSTDHSAGCHLERLPSAQVRISGRFGNTGIVPTRIEHNGVHNIYSTFILVDKKSPNYPCAQDKQKRK